MTFNPEWRAILWWMHFCFDFIGFPSAWFPISRAFLCNLRCSWVQCICISGFSIILHPLSTKRKEMRSYRNIICTSVNSFPVHLFASHFHQRSHMTSDVQVGGSVYFPSGFSREQEAISLLHCDFHSPKLISEPYLATYALSRPSGPWHLTKPICAVNLNHS